MMHLYWSTLVLCLSANADSNALWRDSGENVSLVCSSAGCSSSIEGYDGMYLYLHRDHKEWEEVLYYHSYPGSADKISPRLRYSGRIKTKGSLKNHTITISKLTVDDSGFYKCVYIKIPNEVQCSVYTLFIRGVETCSRSTEVPCALANEKRSPLVLIIVATCTISMLVTVIFILLIIPRVKRWTSSRRRTTSVLQVSSDNVYEVMTKNSLRPPQEQSSPSLYAFA